MNGWTEEYLILRKLIEMLKIRDRFLFKYFVSEFSKLKMPDKMTKEELKEYGEKIMIYI